MGSTIALAIDHTIFAKKLIGYVSRFTSQDKALSILESGLYGWKDHVPTTVAGNVGDALQQSIRAVFILPVVTASVAMLVGFVVSAIFTAIKKDKFLNLTGREKENVTDQENSQAGSGEQRR